MGWLRTRATYSPHASGEESRRTEARCVTRADRASSARPCRNPSSAASRGASDLAACMRCSFRAGEPELYGRIPQRMQPRRLVLAGLRSDCLILAAGHEPRLEARAPGVEIGVEH